MKCQSKFSGEKKKVVKKKKVSNFHLLRAVKIIYMYAGTLTPHHTRLII